MDCVYILASFHRVLYIGVTGKLEERVIEHKSHKYPRSFTAQYNCTRLVYVEQFDRVVDAIAREKQLKGWRRDKKLRLIQSLNPDWIDLAAPPALPGPSLRSG
jgi:putative endonuclease